MRRLREMSNDGSMVLAVVLLVMVAAFTSVGPLAAWLEQPSQGPTAQAQIIPGPAVQVATLVTGASTVSGGNWQMTGITSGTAVAVTVPAGTGRLEIQAEDGSLRWTSDGTSPTSSVGSIIYAGDSRTFTASLAAIELIAILTTAKANLHGTNR